jgi:predicted nucleotidyltransferase
MKEDVLTAQQRTVADRVLDDEAARREHVVVYLSGAHAYGFPSPDSDLDLKAVHIAPTSALLGLSMPVLTFDRAEIIEGVEIDYTSNEISTVLAGILQGNGNFLERVLGRTAFRSSPTHDELRPIVHANISRRVYKHYRGFATSQQKELEKKPTVKKLLYVLRTALTGMHLLRTGELETDVTLLLDDYSLADAHALVVAKRAGERTAADPALLDAWRPRLDETLKALDRAHAESSLPDEPRNPELVQAWLVGARRSRLN